MQCVDNGICHLKVLKGGELAFNPQKSTSQTDLQETVEQLPDTDKLPTGISLSELMASVGDVIQAKFTDLVWVRAEISQLRPIKGDHIAIELVEHDAAGKMVARVQAFIGLREKPRRSGRGWIARTR